MPKPNTPHYSTVVPSIFKSFVPKAGMVCCNGMKDSPVPGTHGHCTHMHGWLAFLPVPPAGEEAGLFDAEERLLREICRAGGLFKPSRLRRLAALVHWGGWYPPIVAPVSTVCCLQ